MKKAFFLISISLFIFSCNSIKKEDISVIENLTLGTSTDSLYKQMKAKSIPVDKFTTSYLIVSLNQFEDESNYLNFPYTNLFNSFANQSQEHFGLLHPITLSGTNNVIGIVVLLGHTKEPVLLGNTSQYKYLNTSKFIKQSVNKKLIEQITDMYTSKYGVPKNEYSSEYHDVYKITDGKIKEFSSDNIEGKTIVWETEYLEITFFTGFKNYFEGCYYKPIDKFYLDINFTNVPVDYNNRMDCYAYSFIQYKLKENAIKQLKLNTSNF